MKVQKLLSDAVRPIELHLSYPTAARARSGSTASSLVSDSLAAAESAAASTALAMPASRCCRLLSFAGCDGAKPCSWNCMSIEQEKRWRMSSSVLSFRSVVNAQLPCLAGCYAKSAACRRISIQR